MIRLVQLQISGDDALAVTTAEGWLEIPDAVIARAGVLEYQRGDGRIVRELRDPSVIHSKAALESYEGRPLLLGSHPTNQDGQVMLADEENTADLPVIGSIRNVRSGLATDQGGEEHRVTLADVLIWHGDGIRAARNGVRQFSAGYRTAIETKPGQYQGQEYDARQVQDIGNHLVLTPNARAGDITEFRLDTADAMQTTPPNAAIAARGNMATLELDGVSGEVPDDLKEAIDRLIDQAATVKAELETALQERDALAAQLAELETADQAEGPAKPEDQPAPDADQANGDQATIPSPDPVLDNLVQLRLELVDQARSVVGSRYAYQGRTNQEIRLDTISAVIPDLSMEGLTEEEIKGAYLVALRGRSSSGSQQLAAATRGDTTQNQTKPSAKQRALAWYNGASKRQDKE